MKRTLFTFIVLAAASSTALAETTIAIEGATVHTAPGKILKNATVLIKGGVIADVGTSVRVPAKAQRIDARGKIVTAGFVESSTRLGLVEVSLESATREGAFNGGDAAIHAAYQVIDGYNPASVAIPVARSGGVTAAVTTPTGGLIAGQSAWISTSAGKSSDLIVKSPAAMYASLGEGALASAKGSRGLAVQHLRELFDDATQYKKNKRAFERNQTRRYAAGRLDLEALLAVKSGAIPLVFRVHRSSDILAAIRLARELGIRIIVEGGVEAWTVASELAAAKVPVILDPAANLPRSFDRTRVRNDAAAVLAKAGVLVAISTLGDAAGARTIRQLAGIAIANGLDRTSALASLTTVPAKIFGIDKRGRIARGAAADIVVWSGDPFELSTEVEHIIIDGVQQSLESHQTRLLKRYR